MVLGVQGSRARAGQVRWSFAGLVAQDRLRWPTCLTSVAGSNNGWLVTSQRRSLHLTLVGRISKLRHMSARLDSRFPMTRVNGFGGETGKRVGASRAFCSEMRRFHLNNPPRN